MAIGRDGVRHCGDGRESRARRADSVLVLCFVLVRAVVGGGSEVSVIRNSQSRILTDTDLKARDSA